MMALLHMSGTRGGTGGYSVDDLLVFSVRVFLADSVYRGKILPIFAASRVLLQKRLLQ
jgi:hypothetical protein